MNLILFGPPAAGKGTLSRLVAEHYGFHHLDTGLTYRAVAKALLDAGLPLDDEAVAEKTALETELAGLDRSVLAQHTIGEAASKIAVMPAVRRALVAAQRKFAAREPGTVLDGRDIGTVIAPDAPAKLYVTATPEVRAERRWKQLTARGQDIAFNDMLEDIRRRDERDSGRDSAPMVQAEDAVLLDTTDLGIEAAFDAARRIVEAARVRAGVETLTGQIQRS